jgi:hypothetical protein
MRWQIEIIYSRLNVRRKGFYLTRLGDVTTREASVRKTAQKNMGSTSSNFGVVDTQTRKRNVEN